MLNLSINIIFELIKKNYKLSNKEIFIFLRTITAFIKRATEKLKLQINT